MTTRAVGYVRLSSLTEQTTSPERQREQIRAYCQSKGWELADIIEDLGESGSRVGKGLQRPGLQSIRDDWTGYDVLVAAKLDRLARNVRDFATLSEEARANDCAVAVVSEGLDLSTSTGRFVATILAAFAEMEADQIKDRIVSMRDDIRRNHAGRYMGGTVPYGYKTAPRDEGGKTLVLDETEAERTREAAERVLAGETLYAVCKDWNQRGIPSKKGSKWNTVTMHALLTGYAVIGVQARKGVPDRDDDGMLSVVFPPALDTTTWGQLRAKLERATRGPKRRKPAQLLAGLAQCAECGKPLYSRTRRRNGAPIYQCNGRSAGMDCTVGGVMAHHLDAEVERRLLDRCGDWMIQRRVQQQSDNSAQLAEVQEAINDTSRQLADDDDNDALARLTELKSRRAELRATPETAEALEWVGFVDDYWNSGTQDERAALLRSMLDAVKVGPGEKYGGVFDPGRVMLDWAEGSGLDTWPGMIGVPAGQFVVTVPYASRTADLDGQTLTFETNV